LSVGARLLKAEGFRCRCSADARTTLLATRESARGAFSSEMKNKVVRAGLTLNSALATRAARR